MYFVHVTSYSVAARLRLAASYPTAAARPFPPCLGSHSQPALATRPGRAPRVYRLYYTPPTTP